MKKLTIIVGLLIANTLLAADGTCSWTTWVRSISCSGYYHGGAGSNAPTALFCSEFLPETYYISTNPIEGYVLTPRSLTANNWTIVSTGYVTAATSPKSHWYVLKNLTYDAACCEHTNAWLGFEFKDVADFTGGLIGTNEQKVTYLQIYLGQGNAHGVDDNYGYVSHEVDDGSLRLPIVHESWPGQGRTCFKPEYRLRQYYFLSGTNKTLKIRGTTNQANTTVIVYTNAVLNTNWLQATPVTLDSNAEADVDISNWALPTNSAFFNLWYTNNP